MTAPDGYEFIRTSPTTAVSGVYRCVQCRVRIDASETTPHLIWHATLIRHGDIA